MPVLCCLALEAGVIIIVCPGPSERHDHMPGSSSDSTEKPLIEDALEESEPERERQTEREGGIWSEGMKQAVKLSSES